MGFVIGLLTVAMVLDCIVLILLVLMQLPKKEAGAGIAFGGAATDALFGAGSGNFLTKTTKYASGIFFVLAIMLSVLQNAYAHRSGSQFMRELQQQQSQQQAPITAPPAAPAPAPSAPAPAANTNLLLTPATSSAPAATNPPQPSAPQK